MFGGSRIVRRKLGARFGRDFWVAIHGVDWNY